MTEILISVATERARSRDPNIKDPTPTLVDI